MNLLLINYEFPPLGAGASTATYHIGKELVAMGHEITILTSGYKKNFGYDSDKGMTIFRCPAIRRKISESNILEMLSFVMSAFFFMPWIIKKHRIQGAIVFFSFPCGPLGLWAKILFKIPYIISLRGGDVPGNEKRLDPIHKILQPVRRLILKKSRAVVANSEGLKKLAQKADPMSVSIILNGIDTAYFKPGKNRIEKSRFSFTFVGRLSEQKNLFFLIEQISILKNQTPKLFTLDIVGDGSLKNELKQFSESLGISDRIKWHGWLKKKQILKILQESDCFLNPSFNEGMPNAVLEAMACGLPVIASNVAGNETIVIHGKTGFLFELGDSKKFNEYLNRIMECPYFRLPLGEMARKKMINKFSWHKTATGYADVFDSRNQAQGISD